MNWRLFCGTTQPKTKEADMLAYCSPRSSSVVVRSQNCWIYLNITNQQSHLHRWKIFNLDLHHNSHNFGMSPYEQRY